MIAALTTSSFAAEFCGPVCWTTCMDLGVGYVGSLAGAMNTLAHFAINADDVALRFSWLCRFGLSGNGRDPKGEPQEDYQIVR